MSRITINWDKGLISQFFVLGRWRFLNSSLPTPWISIYRILLPLPSGISNHNSMINRISLGFPISVTEKWHGSPLTPTCWVIKLEQRCNFSIPRGCSYAGDISILPCPSNFHPDLFSLPPSLSSHTTQGELHEFHFHHFIPVEISFSLVLPSLADVPGCRWPEIICRNARNCWPKGGLRISRAKPRTHAPNFAGESTSHRQIGFYWMRLPGDCSGTVCAQLDYSLWIEHYEKSLRPLSAPAAFFPPPIPFHYKIIEIYRHGLSWNADGARLTLVFFHFHSTGKLIPRR